MSTLEAIKRFNEGELNAFDEIYQENYKRVYFTALHFVKNHADAEDITQEVFCEVYRSLTNLKQPEHFQTWLYRVVYTYFNRVVRKKDRSMKVDIGQDNNIESLVVASDDKTPHEVYNTNEIIAIIAGEINHLQKSHQIVAKMRFYDELSIEEIAEILNVPQGTIKSRLNTIRKELQKNLKQHGVTPSSLYSISLPMWIYAFYYFGEVNMTAGVTMVPWGPAMLLPVKRKQSSTFAKAKVPLALSSAVILSVSGIAYVMNEQPDPPANTLSIQSVTYDPEYTNEALPVKVYVNDPDALITAEIVGANGSLLLELGEDGYQTTLFENGSYTVVIRNQASEVTEYPFVITNIDTTIPFVAGTRVIDDKQLAVQLDDDLSGINYQQAYLIDQDDQIIRGTVQGDELVFDIDVDRSYTLHVEDLAANINEYAVTFYQ